MFNLWLEYKIGSEARKQAWQHDEQKKEATSRKKQRTEKKTNILADYTEESITCTNIHVRITPFACMLHTRSQPCTQFVKAWILSLNKFLNLIFTNFSKTQMAKNPQTKSPLYQSKRTKSLLKFAAIHSKSLCAINNSFLTGIYLDDAEVACFSYQ